jgi:hypothetical protein
MSLYLMNMLGLSSSVRIAHIACYWKFFLLHYTEVLCQYRHCRAHHANLTYLMLQRQLSHLNGLSLTTTKFKPLVFSMSGFALSHTANTFILMPLYNFCFLPAQFCYIVTNGRLQAVCNPLSWPAHEERYLEGGAVGRGNKFRWRCGGVKQAFVTLSGIVWYIIFIQ